MKWILIAVLIVVGVIAGIFAFEYLTNSVGHLPSWVPGHVARRKTRGHMHKRGYVAAIVAIGAFATAGWLIYKNRLAAKSAGGATTEV